MRAFKENIYKSRRELLLTGLCKLLLGFTYRGTGNFSLEYNLCGNNTTTQHTFSGLPGNGAADAYYDITTDVNFPSGLCVKENSVVKISGGSPIVFNPNYDISTCSIAPPPTPAFYAIQISNSTAVSNCAGAGVSTYPITVFIQTTPIIVGSVIYTDSTLTAPFEGDTSWYSYSSTFSMRISFLGVVLQIDNSCAPPA